MVNSAISAIVLAGGIGSRFHSKRPKIVHPLLGKPMLAWIVEASRTADIRDIVIVASPATKLEIEQTITEVRIAVQPQAVGTGDAAQHGLSMIDHDGLVLVAAGDTPCIKTQTIQNIIDTADDNTIALLTCEVTDPTGYGRILRDQEANVSCIVEHKDASGDVLKIREINAGLYVFPAQYLRSQLPKLGTDNAQGEKYLVDLIAQANKHGIRCHAVKIHDEAEIQGVNDRIQLELAAHTLRQRTNQAWQEAGVTICMPDTVEIGPDVVLQTDVTIDSGVQLSGSTQICSGSRIGKGSVLNNSTVGNDCEIRPYVVCDDAILKNGVIVGPFAHLRPGTYLSDHTKIGNFVETKNAQFGKGSKANHLAYIGDAKIGDRVNIGAGTITCNYDGANKHQTILEDEVHIGSDTQLIAPVRVGKGATVGAGTTVSKDVPVGVLAVSRPPQKHIEGYQRKIKEKES